MGATAAAYKPCTGANPARAAYAIDCGTSTSPTLIPAIISALLNWPIAAFLFSNDLMMKMLKDEKLTDEEMKKFAELQEKIKEHFKHRTISDSTFDL